MSSLIRGQYWPIKHRQLVALFCLLTLHYITTITAHAFFSSKLAATGGKSQSKQAYTRWFKNIELNEN